jgi:hypothetical protein
MLLFAFCTKCQCGIMSVVARIPKSQYPLPQNTLRLFIMQIWGIRLSESHILDATFRRPCGNLRRAVVALIRWGCKAIVTRATQAYVLDSV